MRKRFVSVPALALAALAFSSAFQSLAVDPSVDLSSWASTHSMPKGRWWQTSTTLLDGTVLVAGGEAASGAGVLNTALTYDPKRQIWSSTGKMVQARSYFRAVLQKNGRVLAIGGIAPNRDALAATEVYNPTTRSWQRRGSMNLARQTHTATLLLDNTVLVAGGNHYHAGVSDITDTAELYNPSTGRWTQISSMSVPRDAAAAVLLPNGQVLVAGGESTSGGTALASAELYDPITGTWSTTGSMHVGRRDFTANLLPNGKVLVAGGITSGYGNYTETAELYDPASGGWALTGSMAEARADHNSAVLLFPFCGNVLVAGGTNDEFDSLTGAEVYSPVTGTWSQAPSMAEARQGFGASLMGNGEVLVTGGGASGVVLSSAETYVPLSALAEAGAGLGAPVVGSAQVCSPG